MMTIPCWRFNWLRSNSAVFMCKGQPGDCSKQTRGHDRERFPGLALPGNIHDVFEQRLEQQTVRGI